MTCEIRTNSGRHKRGLPLPGGWMVLALALTTLPGTIALAFLTLGALLPARRRPRRNPSGPLRFAAVIPAHDEEELIGRAVSSLIACDRGQHVLEVFVVADNCTDQTSGRARAAGARVLVRQNPERRGKGYALAFAFARLLEERYDAFVIVDADSVVSPNLLSEVGPLLATGADAVQVRYGVLNRAASIRSRLMNVALLAFNFLRPRGRVRWGLSAGLLGNGFVLTRETLQAVPFDAHSIVEDLEYHLRLLGDGRRVEFAENASVHAEMPTRGAGVRTQRARWEGGRLRMVGEYAPWLARQIGRGRLSFVEPLLDLLLLPLAWHVVLLFLLLLTPIAAIGAYAAAALGLVAAHVLVAVLLGGDRRDLLALTAVPFYVAWKVLLLPAIWLAARRDSEWIRTRRETPTGVVG